MVEVTEDLKDRILYLLFASATLGGGIDSARAPDYKNIYDELCTETRTDINGKIKTIQLLKIEICKIIDAQTINIFKRINFDLLKRLNDTCASKANSPFKNIFDNLLTRGDQDEYLNTIRQIRAQTDEDKDRFVRETFNFLKEPKASQNLSTLKTLFNSDIYIHFLKLLFPSPFVNAYCNDEQVRSECKEEEEEEEEEGEEEGEGEGEGEGDENLINIIKNSCKPKRPKIPFFCVILLILSGICGVNANCNTSTILTGIVTENDSGFSTAELNEVITNRYTLDARQNIAVQRFTNARLPDNQENPDKACFLYHGVGTGKTMTALSLALGNLRNKHIQGGDGHVPLKVLIIGPSGLFRGAFYEDALKTGIYTREVQTSTIPPTDPGSKVRKESFIGFTKKTIDSQDLYEIEFTGYDYDSLFEQGENGGIENIINDGYDVIICDEAHRLLLNNLKRDGEKYTRYEIIRTSYTRDSGNETLTAEYSNIPNILSDKRFLDLVSKTKQTIFLTGTPFQNTPSDMTEIAYFFNNKLINKSNYNSFITDITNEGGDDSLFQPFYKRDLGQNVREERREAVLDLLFNTTGTGRQSMRVLTNQLLLNIESGFEGISYIAFLYAPAAVIIAVLPAATPYVREALVSFFQVINRILPNSLRECFHLIRFTGEAIGEAVIRDMHILVDHLRDFVGTLRGANIPGTTEIITALEQFLQHYARIVAEGRPPAEINMWLRHSLSVIVRLIINNPVTANIIPVPVRILINVLFPAVAGAGAGGGSLMGGEVIHKRTEKVNEADKSIIKSPITEEGKTIIKSPISEEGKIIIKSPITEEGKIIKSPRNELISPISPPKIDSDTDLKQTISQYEIQDSKHNVNHKNILINTLQDFFENPTIEGFYDIIEKDLVSNYLKEIDPKDNFSSENEIETKIHSFLFSSIVYKEIDELSEPNKQYEKEKEEEKEKEKEQEGGFTQADAILNLRILLSFITQFISGVLGFISNLNPLRYFDPETGRFQFLKFLRNNLPILLALLAYKLGYTAYLPGALNTGLIYVGAKILKFAVYLLRNLHENFYRYNYEAFIKHTRPYVSIYNYSFNKYPIHKEAFYKEIGDPQLTRGTDVVSDYITDFELTSSRGYVNSIGHKNNYAIRNVTHFLIPFTREQHIKINSQMNEDIQSAINDIFNPNNLPVIEAFIKKLNDMACWENGDDNFDRMFSEIFNIENDLDLDAYINDYYENYYSSDQPLNNLLKNKQLVLTIINNEFSDGAQLFKNSAELSRINIPNNNEHILNIDTNQVQQVQQEQQDCNDRNADLDNYLSTNQTIDKEVIIGFFQNRLPETAGAGAGAGRSWWDEAEAAAAAATQAHAEAEAESTAGETAMREAQARARAATAAAAAARAQAAIEDIKYDVTCNLKKIINNRVVNETRFKHMLYNLRILRCGAVYTKGQFILQPHYAKTSFGQYEYYLPLVYPSTKRIMIAFCKYLEHHGEKYIWMCSNDVDKSVIDKNYKWGQRLTFPITGTIGPQNPNPICIIISPDNTEGFSFIYNPAILIPALCNKAGDEEQVHGRILRKYADHPNITPDDYKNPTSLRYNKQIYQYFGGTEYDYDRLNKIKHLYKIDPNNKFERATGIDENEDLPEGTEWHTRYFANNATFGYRNLYNSFFGTGTRLDRIAEHAYESGTKSGQTNVRSQEEESEMLSKEKIFLRNSWPSEEFHLEMLSTVTQGANKYFNMLTNDENESYVPDEKLIVPEDLRILLEKYKKYCVYKGSTFFNCTAEDSISLRSNIPLPPPPQSGNRTWSEWGKTVAPGVLATGLMATAAFLKNRKGGKTKKRKTISNNKRKTFSKRNKTRKMSGKYAKKTNRRREKINKMTKKA